MKQRDGDRVRKSIENDFVNDVPPRADRVPAHTQRNYPDPFPDRGPLHCSHLPARSDESPAECLVAPGEGRQAGSQLLRQTIDDTGHEQRPVAAFKIKYLYCYTFLRCVERIFSPLNV